MSEEKEEFRAFTVRIPLSQYVEIATMAKADSVHINKKVTQLLMLGMDKHISLDAALLRLLKTKVATND